MKTRQRSQVLIKPNREVADLLKANPGQWYVVGAGDLDRARVLSQTAYRIRKNYRKGVGLSEFRATSEGEFEAVATADQSRPDQNAPVELRARWVEFGREPSSPAP